MSNNIYKFYIPVRYKAYGYVVANSKKEAMWKILTRQWTIQWGDPCRFVWYGLVKRFWQD